MLLFISNIHLKYFSFKLIIKAKGACQRVIDLNRYTGGGLQIESDNLKKQLMKPEDDVMDFVYSLECQRNLDIIY